MERRLSNYAKAVDGENANRTQRQQQELQEGKQESDDILEAMTRKLPGILRLDPDDCQTDEFGSSSTTNERQSFASSQEAPPSDIREERPRTKKRVTFQAEEHLEVVMEISPRLDSPLSEELEPCDPEKLMFELECPAIHGGEFYGAGYSANGNGSGGRVSGKKAGDAITRISGIMGFRLPAPVAPPLIGARKGRPGLPDRRMNNQERKHMTGSSGISAHKRIRSAPPLKPSSPAKDLYCCQESPMEQRFARHVSSKQQPGIRSRSSMFRVRMPTAGNICRGSHSRPKSPVGKRELLTPNLNVNRSRGFQVEMHKQSAYSRGQLVHQSPYRQGSASGSLAGGGARRSTTAKLKSDASLMSSLSVTGSRMDAHSKSERRAVSAPSVSPRKIQAWHEANNALRTNGLLVSEPCIAQLWDSPKNTVDSR